MLKTADLEEKRDTFREWYDGYVFGNEYVYCPWDVVNYTSELLYKKTAMPKNYWANTSENLLVEKLIREGSVDVKKSMESLLSDRSVEALIDDEIVFNLIDKNESGIFSLLLASGYLKIDEVLSGEGVRKKLLVSLTNLEVKHVFEDMIKRWFEGDDIKYNDFIKALILNDIKYMNRFMNEVALSTFSSFDTGRS